MLESLLGVRVLIWTGGLVPTPHFELADALESIQVTNDTDAGDGFQMTFNVGKDTFGGYDVLDGGALELMNRVWIAVVLGVVPEVLIDGVITRHDLRPSDDPGRSTFTVTGTDVSLELDLEEKNAPFSNQPDYVIVSQILLSYPQYGLVPMVTPTTDFPIEMDRIPRQHETDLAFIRRAADRNSFVFYVQPLTLGVNTAYWGPVVRAGIPQPAITLGLGPDANCNSLSFSNDGLAPVGASGSFLEPITKVAIPIPALPALRLPPLAASPTPTSRTTLLRESGNESPIQAALASAAAATRAPEAVTGNGEVDTARYGSVLRARGLVGVRGAGRDYDGFYFVRSVTHSIRKGSYRQAFTLSREGTGSLLPAVLP
ncbi:MAG TPA: hypothetical protein VH419_05340 [Nocardioidaceae bacterium]